MSGSEKFRVGESVRSYDFPDSPLRKLCYVEGTLEAIGVDGPEGCKSYKIKVTKRVIQGVERAFDPGLVVYPPINGLPTWLGTVTDGVVRL